MIFKIIGVTVTVASCSGLGFKIAAAYLKEISVLKKLIGALDLMECELQYRLTPLPDLCRTVAADNKGVIGSTFSQLANALEDQISPDVDYCMTVALSKTDNMPRSAARILRQLGQTMGRFDVDGQIKGLEAVRQEGRNILDQLTDNQSERVRSFKTLGICAGAAIAILLI